MQPQIHIWQDKRIVLAVLAALLLLGAFLAVQTINSIKQFQFIGEADQFTNTITVQGMGEVFAVPDIATFSFSVIEEAADASSAQDAAAKKINNILAFIREQGIEEKDIKTTSFNLSPRYEFRSAQSQTQVLVTEPAIGILPPDRNRVLVGFEVRQRVEVKVRDTKRAGQLISGVSELGASEASQLSFTIDDDEKLMADARSAAIADAKAKAEALADELDVRLVRILNFNEFGQPEFFARGGEFSVATLDEGVTVPELPSGENKITSQVSITYEIR